MFRIALVLFFAAAAGCGGGTSNAEPNAPERVAPIAAPPAPSPAFAPRVVDVVSVPGRVRSLAQGPAGRWILSRFSAGQTVPAVLEGATLEPLPGWTVTDV